MRQKGFSISGDEAGGAMGLGDEADQTPDAPSVTRDRSHDAPSVTRDRSHDAPSVTRDRSLGAPPTHGDGPERARPASEPGLPDGPGEGRQGHGLGERYEIVGLLGRGGMGEVYEARDLLLGRDVALKFLLAAGAERALRLLQEARAQARIDHPNICKVYEAGDRGGKLYIAMQLVRGRPLGEAAAELSLPEKVQIMRQVAEAMHEAHRLGVIHRDLKPSNILLGQANDGRWVPTVMDFGLAYEVQRGHGLTGTWALMGTPSYMAPEQARGEVRSVDRRSDVYSLGATLYELLTGEVPFAAPTVAATVHRLLHDEPKPPRAIVPQLPVDLETITLKCLHKDPDRRYVTARALGEDLGRYLEGEPIVGRRPGPVERLRRQARKHRALFTLAALSLAVTLVLAAFGARSWLEARRARAEAGERERLAQDLGQQAKEIEWFLREAYALPLHDTTREQQYVRERMARVAARGREAGGRGEGLAHYALGRGHLALGEFGEARGELERARRAGFDAPELHYALGRALGELYRRALDDARLSGGGAWVAGQQKGLERQYLEPALAALEKSRGLELESPRYLEGLIAFYRRDFGAAARAVEQVKAEAPWEREAHQLGGDVAYARAMERFDRGEYDEARAGLEGAIGLYEQAADVGRSDARAYAALAEAWQQHADLDQRQGKPGTEPLARALEAAGKAVRAAPSRASGYTRQAYVLMRQYKLVNLRGGGDPKPILAEWLALAARAVELDPNDVYAHDVLGLGHYRRGLEEARQHRDPGPAWDEAVACLKRALELQPNYPWALNDVALVFRLNGNYQDQHGRDPRGIYAEAERHFLQAIQSDPAYLFAYQNLGDLYNDLAEYELSRGLDPRANVEKAREVGERALALDGRFYLVLNQLAVAELTLAQHLFDRGADPGPPLGRAFEYLERSLAINATFVRTFFCRAQGHYLTALHALREGRDPLPSLEAGRRALGEAHRNAVDCVDCRVLGAQMLLAEARWAQRRGRVALPTLQRALAEARQAVETFPYLQAHQELARIYWHLAEAQPTNAPFDALEKGMAQVDLALRLDENRAHVHAIRAELLLARARATGKAEVRLDAARQARAALARAFELNPLLRREYEGAAGEAERLLRATSD
jgi:eukaryotic-like serine/threonine-protein kinase